MRYQDWKTLRLFGYLSGTLMFIGALFAYFYVEEQNAIFFRYIVAPYRDWAAPLVLLGVFLLVLGYVSSRRAIEEDIEESQPLTEKPEDVAQGFCKYCGNALSREVKYCPNCGKPRD